MKFKTILTLLTMIICSMLLATPSGYSQLHSSPRVLLKKTIEITGDKYEDQIVILQPHNGILKVMFRDGFLNRSDQLSIHAESIDVIRFVDFTGDHLPELFLTTKTKDQKKSYHVVSGQGHRLTSLPIPLTLQLSGRFLDGYRAVVLNENTGVLTTVNLAHKKTNYEQAAIYKQGKLIKPIKLSSTSPTLIPMDLDGDGIFELQSKQQVTASNQTIAYSTSQWKMEDAGWRLLSSSVHK
ncbi:hypothetical protein A374_07864 [Fictibacillus macauensis ZFHKF-1]|uniref:FG-GAP repeat-containing protein n=1 Tax=Fictibacillus macauensis ZFHKF-1 TaxID=1196324 RepID=I8AJM3_9BACL|nr:hypothetical protein [Fictibacillus macauensis]EIT85734.1 hypothetical protein A374_07864 [Fictibacillus macauensis ZFHKF-1]